MCFITDAHSRRIVGWRAASNMRTQMVLDALEMARWSRGVRLDEHLRSLQQTGVATTD